MADSTAQRIWDTALGQLQLHVTRPNYDTWLKDTEGLRVEPGIFVVGVPSEFVKEWLATRMRGVVSETVGGILGEATDVSFEIVGTNGASNGTNGHTHEGSTALDNGTSAATAIAASPTTRQRLNPRYIFQSFVVAESNRLAVAAAIACAERPGEDYNPVFIYGSPGLGKTHLLQAVAQRANQCGHEAVYVTSEHFTNEFITAVAQSRTDEFRRRYRSAKLLCIDDIQFIAGKGRTQEEFFYTFNDLHTEGCQIVLAADRPPTAITGFEPRLSSRFGWGLIADIQPPDEETRLAILQCKAREQRVELPPDVARFLADRTRDNVRELEGTLNQVVALARITTMRINMDLARKAIAALSPTVTSPSDPQAIIRAVGEYYGVSPQQITGKSRAKPIAEARHVAMYIMREDGELALKQIGLHLGHRDHSTVIHGIQKITRLLATDQKLAAQLTEIRSDIS